MKSMFKYTIYVVATAIVLLFEQDARAAGAQQASFIVPNAPWAQPTTWPGLIGSQYTFLIQDQGTKAMKNKKILLEETFTYTTTFYNAGNIALGGFGPTTDGGYTSYNGSGKTGLMYDDPVSMGAAAILNQDCNAFLANPHPNAPPGADFKVTWIFHPVNPHSYDISDNWEHSAILLTSNQGVYAVVTWPGGQASVAWNSSY